MRYDEPISILEKSFQCAYASFVFCESHSCKECEFHVPKEKHREALDAVIAALTGKGESEEKSEPLTLDELRKLNGQPVYVAVKSPRLECWLWGIVSTEEISPHFQGGFCQTAQGILLFSDYGLT